MKRMLQPLAAAVPPLCACAHLLQGKSELQKQMNRGTSLLVSNDITCFVSDDVDDAVIVLLLLLLLR